MALKLPDSAVPMGDFPVAKAVDIDFNDGENLQEKLDNGKLGGAGGGASTYTSLEALGLTAPVTVGEIFNAMPNKTMAVIACEGKEGNTTAAGVHVSDVPESFGVLTIKKNEKGRFSIDYQNSLGGSAVNVRRWIGTVKGNDGSGLYWKEIQVTNGEIITSDTIAKYGTEILKYPIGTWRIDNVNTGKQFTDLPYAEMAGVIEIDSIYPNKSPYEHAYGYRNYTFRDALTNAVYTRSLNSGNTVGTLQRDSGWKQTGGSKVTLVLNSKTFKIDITKGRESWNGNMKFGYYVDSSYGEIIITSVGTTNVTWSCSEGVRYVKSVTYTINQNNNARITIGVELYDVVYGVHSLETTSDFAKINSFTGDAFTGTSVAERCGVRGRNNGVGILCDVADLGLTLPCTTVQIAQTMRNLANSMTRMPASGMIGIFDNGGNKITDAPTEYGLLQINAYGYDRVMIRYDGAANSNHTGSWIGQIKASSGGTFSGITWSRLDLEAQVNELFQSVSDGKTLVANAITGKGVSTATDATFATMATNIGKISGGYKEETKSLIVTKNTTDIEALPFKFSANVIAVKQITPPSDSCRIVKQTSKDVLTINGSQLVLYVTGSGTWKVTALIEK